MFIFEKNKKMNLRYTISLTIILFSILLPKADEQYSTKEFSILPPSPEVSAMKRYYDFSVSGLTGQPTITLPIYQLNEGSLSVPISIGYNSGGIRVYEYPGIIGLGWTLLAGGNISRTVYGLPDDISNIDSNLMGLFSLDQTNKYLRNYVMNKPTDYTYFNSLSEYCIEISKYCQDYEEWRVDVANDVLSLSGMGLDGVFSYNDNKQLVLQSSSNITFESNNLNNETYPLSYVIEDDYGTKYTYGEQEKTVLEYIYYNDRFNDPTTSKQRKKYVSAWHLTKLQSLQGDEILFEYKQTGKRRYATSSYYSYEKGDNNIVNSFLNKLQSNTTYLEYYPKLLWRIKSKSTTIEFEYDSLALENSSSYYDRLKRILVRRNDAAMSVVKTFEFIQNAAPTFGNIKGKQLESVYECSNEQQRIKLYGFEYITSEAIKNNFTNAQDHWGFYNGQNNNTLLPKSNNVILNSNYNNANREPDESCTKFGVLKKIYYPTGGYTQFTWEQHDYSYINSQRINGSSVTETQKTEKQLFGIKKYELLETILDKEDNDSFEIDVSTYVKPLESTGWISGAANTWTDYLNSHSDAYADYLFYPHVAITNMATSQVVKRIYIDKEHSDLGFITVSLPNGKYKFSLENHLNMHEGLLGFFLKEETKAYGYVTIRKTTTTTHSEKFRKWGGLRIAQIASSTNEGTANSIIKTYKYRDNYSTNTYSSGVIPCEPNYEFEFAYGAHHENGIGDDVDIVYGITSNGLPTTVCGKVDIQYHKVFETIGIGEEQQIIEYNYSTMKEIPDVLNMGFYTCSPAASKIYTSNAFRRGNLISKKYTNTIHPTYNKTQYYNEELLTGSNSTFCGDFVTIGDFIHCNPTQPQTWKDYTVSTYSLTPYCKRIKSTKTEETSIWGNYLEQTIEYTYFNDKFIENSAKNNFIRSTISYDSEGRKKETYYTYYQGKYNYPETEVTVIENTIVSSSRNIYQNGRIIQTFNGPMGIPVKPEYELGNDKNTSDALKEMINIPAYAYKYNNDGNIIEISFNGTILASYLWGYKGMYPIVEVRNMSYSTLQSKAQEAGINAEALAECYDNEVLASFFTSLRNACYGYDVYTMAYHWLIGVSAATTPNGITTYFTYDDFGRLENVKDYNQYFIRKYKYNYKNQ